MTIKVLAIGDIGNVLQTIRKYTKKSEIHIINFSKDGAGIYTYADNVETFQTYKVSDHVKKINEIADNYDICITMGTGERIAYLADLKYVTYYAGRDIDAPRFIKNSKEEWFNEPLHRLNFLERWFYKKTFENAIVHLAYTWVFEHLKKYTDRGIKLDLHPVDTQVFNQNIKPLEQKKEKFTFFSPQRMGRPKGTDLIWEALKLCKSDFEIIQVNWFDVSTNEELKIKDELLITKPSQVKLIPMIIRKDMPRYYNFADAVIGNMRIGTYALIELEAIFCGTPVVMYCNPEMKIIVDEKEIKCPMLPISNEPEVIAEIIDKVVTDKDFREQLWQEEYTFAREIADPVKVAKWWDDFFVETSKKNPGIRRKSPRILVKLRMLLFLIGNRLYLQKIKKVLGISN